MKDVGLSELKEFCSEQERCYSCPLMKFCPVDLDFVIAFDEIDIEAIRKILDEKVCKHEKAVSAVNEVIESGYFCPECNSVLPEDFKKILDERNEKDE